MPPKASSSFYAVFNGKDAFCGIVRTWSECEALVRGVGNAQFKKFAREKDACDFIDVRAGRRDSKKKLTKENTIVAFVDGACRDQQNSEKRRAGCGVFFAHPVELTSISTRNPFPPHSAYRSEVAACLLAVEKVFQYLSTPNGKGWTDMLILCDNAACITVFENIASGNGTYDKSGPHRDLWQQVDSMFQQFKKKFPFFTCHISKVRAHSGIDGNEEADRLARDGADDEGASMAPSASRKRLATEDSDEADAIKRSKVGNY